jgi:hypothetical protein
LFTREFGGVELLQPLDAMLDIVVGSLQDDPQTLLFWVIGLLAATYLPYRAIPTEPGAE